MLSHCTAVKACKLANPMFASLCGHRHQTIHTSSKIFAQENIFNRTYDFFDFHFFKKYVSDNITIVVSPTNIDLLFYHSAL